MHQPGRSEPGMCVLQMAFASFPYWVQLPTPTLQHVYRSINGNLKTGHLHSVCVWGCVWGGGRGLDAPNIYTGLGVKKEKA